MKWLTEFSNAWAMIVSRFEARWKLIEAVATSLRPANVSQKICLQPRLFSEMPGTGFGRRNRSDRSLQFTTA
jgi:hypothetical protein